MKKEKMPKEILVYVGDYVDGEPIYCVAKDIDEIPFDVEGSTVGFYVLNKASTFTIKREMK